MNFGLKEEQDVNMIKMNEIRYSMLSTFISKSSAIPWYKLQSEDHYESLNFVNKNDHSLGLDRLPSPRYLFHRSTFETYIIETQSTIHVIQLTKPEATKPPSYAKLSPSEPKRKKKSPL